MTDEKARTKWVALLLIAGTALYLCWRMLQPFIFVLLWAAVLAIVFSPVQGWLARKTGKPGLAAGLSVLLAILLFIIPVGLVGALLAGELRDLATTGPAKVQEYLQDPAQGEKLRHALDFAKKYVDVDKLLSAEAIRGYAQKASSIVVAQTMSVIGGALGILVNLVLVLYTTLFFLKDGRAFVDRLVGLLPVDGPTAVALVSRTRETLKASVFGVMAIAVIQGVLGTMIFVILGLPTPILWGALMTLTSLIPVAGTGLVWVPAALILAATDHWTKALILVLWGLLVIGMADNLLRPRLVGQRIQMNALLVFFAVLGGLQVFGFLGVLLGPVVFALATSLLDVVLGVADGEAGPAEVQAAPVSG
jgi:predicted PurR-regulated permease PerM